MKKMSNYYMSQNQMRQVWECADWERVIATFGLRIDPKRQCKPHELWIKSPFTTEKNASLHLDLKRNIYKDFSSGSGAGKGILTFCQDILMQNGKSLNCYEVAQWMIENGISCIKPGSQYTKIQTYGRDEKEKKNTLKINKPIHIDLRPFMQTDHPELIKRGLSVKTCDYLGCGYLPIPHSGIKQSPLHGRIIFQIRGISENLHKPMILTHCGRALTKKQEEQNGKYWSFPFHKSSELYNQDTIINYGIARNQINHSGLILVEGFFDVASLVEAGCFNVVALMGSHISLNQLDRLKCIQSKVTIPKIRLFFDRDKAGVEGAKKTYSILSENGFTIKIFDWEHILVRYSDSRVKKIPNTINDPGDMSVEQIRWLKKNSRI
jgi:DNA primase